MKWQFEFNVSQISFLYRNYKGEEAIRTVFPKSLWFGVSPYYSEEQWFLKCWDLDKEDERDFALSRMILE